MAGCERVLEPVLLSFNLIQPGSGRTVSTEKLPRLDQPVDVSAGDCLNCEMLLDGSANCGSNRP